MIDKDSAFLVNDWRVDPHALRISRGGQEVRLEPKVMQVLLYLSGRPGQVVSRQELEDHAWEGLVVGYDALTNSILKLRKAFGDRSREPCVIETIPKSGYRLIASVQPLDQAPRARSGAPWRKHPGLPRWSGWTALLPIFALFLVVAYWGFRTGTETGLPLPEQPAIAVMPFLNTGNDPRQNYFADGITEDLITDLSKVSGLFVIARNSSFRYKGKMVDV